MRGVGVEEDRAGERPVEVVKILTEGILDRDGGE